MKSFLSSPGDTNRKKNDIIITRVGSYGITALVDDSNFCLGQNTSAIVPKINPRYLYFALNSPQVKNQIEFSVVGSTQKTLSLKAINNLDIRRFGGDVEDRIAGILGILDDKIELNRQINQNLEEMAQAIFKSWFVDFEPIKAKIEANGQDPERAAICAISGKIDDELDNLPPGQLAQLRTTAALFPDELIDSELGSIPKGWLEATLATIADVKGGKQLNKDCFSENGINPVFGGAGQMGKTDLANAEGFVISVGRVGAYCGQFFWHIGQAWVNNNASLILPKNSAESVWVYQWLRSVDMEPIKKGAAQPFVSNGDISALRMALPPLGHRLYFSEITNDIYEMLHENI